MDYVQKLNDVEAKKKVDYMEDVSLIDVSGEGLRQGL